MNLKKIGFKVAIAAATVAGVGMAVSPAEAVSLGSSVLFDFGGEVASFTADGFILKDNQVRVTDATLSLSPYEGTQAFFANFSLSALTPNKPLFTLSKPGEVNIDFFATSASLVDFDPGVNFIANINGYFNDGTPGNGGAGVFKLTKNINGDAEFEAIPTPALLPGLVGMGLAVLRKRKRDAAEEAEA